MEDIKCDCKRSLQRLSYFKDEVTAPVESDGLSPNVESSKNIERAADDQGEAKKARLDTISLDVGASTHVYCGIWIC